MSEKKATHARLTAIDSGSDELIINGVGLSRLVERAGRTPLYIYDREAISARVASLRSLLPSRVKLHYAVKANPMPAVVGHLRSLVDGFDVASQREMLVALDSGMPDSEISFAGPAKQLFEIRAAIAAGIHINCESETELERIAEQAADLGVTPRIALRVNPDFELKGSGMKMAGSPRQFGIDVARVPQAFKRLRELNLSCTGLHIFCGSQNLRAESIIEANQLTLELAMRLASDADINLSFLNIGGGYGIPYFPGEATLDIAAVGHALSTLLDRFERELAHTEVVVELGRYLVGEAGYYVCRITDIKESQGQLFAMVDGGLHHHLANSGNFGQVLRKNYPVVIGNKLNRQNDETVSIVGPLCTPLDMVADRIAVPKLDIGDLVVVLQSGAYGYTASPHYFLSHPPPLEILV
jgi:diaminopimelate decarboxylase